ncbi:adult-specific rigid cuticular protein 15.7-like [Uloborus diversus]|uniref:adult-specific rigid cuticular protein 15.7-like n=1 Tax=Uloborus diversus TaxID=327109 RepID=UPI00240A2D6A|nr:adult-specific rigid cuticular protein 15.7-like [Uloborus diversus]
MKVIVLLASFALTYSQYLAPNNYGDLAQPTPYQFSYSSPSIGGASSHQESGDGSGRVTGSYSVQDEDGRSRIVEYVADEYGFRASINTNEPGTASQNPADVTINSSADDGLGEPSFRMSCPVITIFVFTGGSNVVYPRSGPQVVPVAAGYPYQPTYGGLPILQ